MINYEDEEVDRLAQECFNLGPNTWATHIHGDASVVYAICKRLLRLKDRVSQLEEKQEPEGYDPPPSRL